MIRKSIIFFGRTATHACDGRCDKAWGINGRPSIPSRAELDEAADPDDYAYLADDELGSAPTVTGITEGGQNKPLDARGPEDINKWCVRECERAWMSPPGQPDAEPDLPDFTQRHYNKAPHRRPAPITALAASLSDEQAAKLTSSLDASQERQIVAAASSMMKKNNTP